MLVKNQKGQPDNTHTQHMGKLERVEMQNQTQRRDEEGMRGLVMGRGEKKTSSLLVINL